ncbi:MAG: BON domain-containing protein [Carbonactinosporaceae bacterium]
MKRLPVVDSDGALTGIVSRRDLLRVFLRSDHDIRREITFDIFSESLWAHPLSVSVDVRDGVVTLSGRLERRSMIPLAVRLVRSVDGVADVVDKLTYATDDTTPDQHSPGVAPSAPRA